MIVTPFMSCSARLPIYVLFSDMFFGDYAAIVAFSMYVIGMAIAILVAKIIHKMEKEQENNSLLIELPEYKLPNPRTIRIYVWNKLKDYLSKAGTTIFVASIIIWFVLNFGIGGMVEDPANSFGASIGRFLVPVLAPAGLGMWQIVVALISGISAKEVVVSSFAVLFGVTNANSQAGMQTIIQNIQNASPGFEAVKRFQPYDFLSALRSLHRDGSYYKKRKRFMEIYIRNDRLSAAICMDGFRSHISNGKPVFQISLMKWGNDIKPSGGGSNGHRILSFLKPHPCGSPLNDRPFHK